MAGGGTNTNTVAPIRATEARLIAPFDGVVVKGDLSQSLGAAVERGNALFELAPLDSYRVIMKVDERDIGEVKVGQKGRLALTSMPNEAIQVVIQKITPVSVVDQGRNFFRVEASATTVDSLAGAAAPSGPSSTKVPSPGESNTPPIIRGPLATFTTHCFAIAVPCGAGAGPHTRRD